MSHNETPTDPERTVETNPGSTSGAPSAHKSRWRRHRTWWTAAGVGIVAVVLVVVLAVQPPAANRPVHSPLIGHPAPPVAGPSVTHSPFSSLAAERGRWVVLNFFATWCIPCQQEQPELARFAAAHQQGDVEVVMVIYNDSTPGVERFLRDRDGTWPAVQDPNGQIALNYGVAGIPETYLIDPRGVVVAKVVGGSTDPGLERLVSQAKARDL